MENQNNVQTSVQQVDLDIDSWLGAPGADSIVTPTATDAKKPEAKPSIFSKSDQDLSFIDSDDTSGDDAKKDSDDPADDKKDIEGRVSRETFADVLDELNQEGQDDPKSKTGGGRPKTDKSGLVEFLKKRIESKEMFAFDDYDESKQSLDEYLGTLGEKDVEELWQANMENLKQEVAAKTPKEFFESLPEELQYAAKYVMDGGQDLKGMFQALAQVEQVRSLDPTNENDQEGIVRSYLSATGFGTEDEIEEELTTWKDLGVLEKKAKQFKPKLDQMQEEIVQGQLAEQEARKQQQEQAAQAYMQNVFEALRPAEINGLKLDKKTQAQLYSGLVQPNYPSISGRPTNQLGHLLEKYQFVEPNYPLIAEALWLLSNPEEYRANLAKQGKNAAVEQTVRQLKTEQSRKNVSTYQEDEDPKSRKIARPQNIFKR
jgi:uncharacterized protein YggL (DUF469 family)